MSGGKRTKIVLKKIAKTASGGNEDSAKSLEHSNEDALMTDEADGEGEDDEEGEQNEIGLNGKRKATPRDTNSKNKRNNNNNCTSNHNKDVEMKEQQEPVCILLTSNNH